jgi:tetratricopeptide (TPR) repeat protein
MKLRILLVIFAAWAGLVGGAGAARAQDESLNRAREAFDKAQSLYAQGSYAEAATQFDAAYQARPFAQFLFNIGACHEKLRQYDQAVDYYQRYLREDPETQDRKDVEKRIAVLKKEAERIKAAPPPDTPDAPPSPVTPSAEVQALEDVKIRGLVVIESDPPGAFIYLDKKESAPLSKTPWNGTMEGEHTIFIDRQGYKPVERRFAPDPKQLSILIFTLAEQDYLGWVDIKSNIPGADVYVDDKSVGVYRKTPFSGNMKPGKHKFWITAEGYDEYAVEVDIIAGKTHEINATLKGSPVGYLNIQGTGVENTTIYLDGKVLCERGPCRKAVQEGTHTLQIKRKGYKTYARKLEVQAKTQVILRPAMAKRPGRGDAVWAYIFTAAFLGGGIYAGLQANGIEDDLRQEIEAGSPPPDSNDPRYLRGKIFAISADAAYALAGVSLLTAVYYTFRDKGRSSTATTDVRAVAVEPSFAPGYAGVGMEVRW